jgi:hypothetical protein
MADAFASSAPAVHRSGRIGGHFPCRTSTPPPGALWCCRHVGLGANNRPKNIAQSCSSSAPAFIAYFRNPTLYWGRSRRGNCGPIAQETHNRIAELLGPVTLRDFGQLTSNIRPVRDSAGERPGLFQRPFIARVLSASSDASRRLEQIECDS